MSIEFAFLLYVSISIKMLCENIKNSGQFTEFTALIKNKEIDYSNVNDSVGGGILLAKIKHTHSDCL